MRMTGADMHPAHISQSEPRSAARPRPVGDWPSRCIAVAIHDVEPATFEPCALIRDWLNDHGVDRVTLLVIPARDLHPISGRSPAMVEWLTDCRQAGDAIAQHGFRHDRLRTVRPGPALAARRPGEFGGLDDAETRRAVDAGRRVLKLAGIDPTGFVAPDYVYTAALHRALPSRFRWWASVMRLHEGEDGGPVPRQLAPPWSLGTAGRLGWLSPTVVRAGARLAGRTLRLDVHPADLRHTRHMLALERVLGSPNVCRRVAVTYDELACRKPAPGARPD